MTLREPRLAGFDVDGHGEEGVDEADGVGSGAGGDARHVRDGGDVGRELDDERALGSALRDFGTRYSSEPGSEPKAMPPACTLGQETLSS